MTHDAMILVTGAAINPQDDEGKEEVAAEVPEEAEESTEEIPEGRPLPVRVWTNKEGRKVRARGVYKAGEDFFWLKAKGKWIAYPLAEISETDRAVLMKVSDSVSP